MKMWRVVFDTNVFVSAVLVKNGLPARALQAWQARQFILLLSPAIIAEIQHTLNYEALWDFVGFCHSERSEESQPLRDASLRSA
jgi:putative PIN family toxin of toxin-antitoxin system